MSKIVIIGSSNVDLTVRTAHIPSKGETIFGGDLKMAFGGKGANQAVAVSRLGGDVSFITKVGMDSYGNMMAENLVKEGMAAETVIRDPAAPSGVAWICVDDNGDNSIIVMPGANCTMTKEDMAPYLSIIKEADYLLMQLETPLDVVDYAASMAYEHGVKVVLNPAPAQPLSDDLLSKIYLLTPNEKECSLLCGDKATDDDSANAAVLRSKGVENVIVTLGEKGSLLCSSDLQQIVPAEKVEAVDTVAAGDTYNGALCVALSEGKTLLEAMKFATKASAIAVTRFGAQPSVPYRKEINQ
ncbi:MAG: ribokinase [Bacteroidales bacterium]|nr:ribokinase [Bacteroidales bacterium]